VHYYDLRNNRVDDRAEKHREDNLVRRNNPLRRRPRLPRLQFLAHNGEAAEDCADPAHNLLHKRSCYLLRAHRILLLLYYVL